MIYYRPCGDLTNAPTPRSQEDRDLYTLIETKVGVRLMIDNSVDYEDWMEPAAMLGAALKMGLDVAILPKIRLPLAMNKPTHVVSGTPCPEILIGRHQKTDVHDIPDMNLAWPPKDEHLPNQYGELETFAKLAGRRTQLAHFPGEHGHSLPFLGNGQPGVDIDTAMAGFETVVIKQVWPAKSFPVTTVEVNGRSGQKVLMDTMEYHVLRFEGDQNALLLQEHIRMRYETRLFVINGKVVCGAGIVEEHTPQQSVCCVVNPIFEETRNDGTRLVNHELALDFNEEGQIIADAIKAESGLDTYVLDLALDDDNAVIIVELNPIAQAGLYGICADLLMEGILEYAQAKA